MGNLGDYQWITTASKKVGGPRVLAAAVAIGGYLVLRPAEAVVRKTIRSIWTRGTPCAMKGLVFEVLSDGEDPDGLALRTSDEYKVLDCVGDVVLIEVLGADDNPHFTSDEFLASVSDFPAPDGQPLGDS